MPPVKNLPSYEDGEVEVRILPVIEITGLPKQSEREVPMRTNGRLPAISPINPNRTQPRIMGVWGPKQTYANLRGKIDASGKELVVQTRTG